MTDHWEPISPEEKDAAVAAILEAGLPPPFRWRALLGMVSIETLFAGVGDSSFLAVLLAGVLYLIGASATAKRILDAAPLLFLLSPALFATLHILTTWKEHMSKLAEWKQTCRVSLHMLTTLRMLVFGSVSVAALVPLSALLWALDGRRIPFTWLVGLACSSLFLYAALTLLCGRLRRRKGMWIPPVLWLTLSLTALWKPQVNQLLLTFPAWVFCLLTVIGIVICLAELKRRVIHPMEGEMAYAVR